MMNCRRFPLLMACIAAILCTNAMADTDIFTLAELRVRAGEVVSGYLEIRQQDDAGARIPVSVIHGSRSGPVLALIAGTHGYEYPGIIALQRLRQSIAAAQLSGTLILVHVANTPSFYGRTIYTSPADGKNLNRVYPGNPEGSLTERIADSITRNVISRADFLVDLHAGDGNEDLAPYVYMPVTGIARLDAASRGLALAFGLDHIVIDEGPLPPAAASVYTDQTALTRGIPAITTETGGLGVSDDYWVKLVVSGIENIMRHLGMVEGPVQPNLHVVWLTDYKVIVSPSTGIFRAAVRGGDTIPGNGLLGELFDPFGVKLEEIRAPFAGFVNYVVRTPPVSQGEPVAMLSHVRRED